jgi:hypothetical protein
MWITSDEVSACWRAVKNSDPVRCIQWEGWTRPFSKRGKMFAALGRGDGHLDAGIVAAYIDGTMDAAYLGEVEAHLAECEPCRREVVEVTRMMRGRRPWKRWAVWGTVAAAAAVLVLIAQPGRAAEFQDPVTRAGEDTATEAVLRFTAIAPADTETGSSGSIVFQWRSPSTEASYRITVTNEIGDLLWSETTSDTTVVLPGDVPLEVGETYFWYVDALLPNGGSATTGVRRLTLVP